MTGGVRLRRVVRGSGRSRSRSWALAVAARHGGRADAEPGARTPFALVRLPDAGGVGATSVTHLHRHAHSHVHAAARIEVRPSVLVHLSVRPQATGPAHRTLIERTTARTVRVEAPTTMPLAEPPPDLSLSPPPPATTTAAPAPAAAPTTLQNGRGAVRTVVVRAPQPPPAPAADEGGFDSGPHPAAGAPAVAAALAPHEVDRLADRVIDVIERRVGAYRERTGRA